MAPAYLQNTLKTQNVKYNLRNQDHLPPMKCRTATHQKSFFPQTISDWNNLDQNIRNTDNLPNFEVQLSNDNKEIIPKWFFTGKRYPSLIHGKLRMLCSPLNDHLYSHIHVIDSPQCPCGHVRETTKHYLLECPLFQNERQEMLQKLNNISFNPTLHNLLYGDCNVDEKTNITAFEIIQSFIERSDRF